jgi:membrane dipeptidase
MRTLTLLILTVLFPWGATLSAQSEPSVKRINRIHKKAVTIDSHTDTPMSFLDEGFSFGLFHDAHLQRSKEDIPRIEAGGLDGIFLAVFVGQQARDDAGNLAAKREALVVFDSIHSNLCRFSDKIELALDAEDIYEIIKKGKHAVFIGLENGYAIGRDISLIDTFYKLGTRYITLCHTSNNDICESSTDRKNEGSVGVTGFGEDVIRLMNLRGLMIDVSHASDSSFYDIVNLSKAPVIASHSCSRALCNNPRNMSDDMLRALAKNEGVIQMCLLSSYVKTPVPQPERDSAKAEVRKTYGDYYSLNAGGKKLFMDAWHKVDEDFPPTLATVSDVVDHIDHIVKVAGIDHVGIGTDFDGGGGVEGCFDVSEMKNITAGLLRRGYSYREIKKIWGGNLLRVFSEVEKTAEVR